jgi:hypothetical protein
LVYRINDVNFFRKNRTLELIPTCLQIFKDENMIFQTVNLNFVSYLAENGIVPPEETPTKIIFSTNLEVINFWNLYIDYYE